MSSDSEIEDEQSRELARGPSPPSGRGGRSPHYGGSTSPFRSRSRSRGSPTGSSGGRGGGYTSEQHALQLPMPASETYQSTVQVENFPAGKVGTRINLLANFFKLNLADVAVIHYDLDFVKQRRVSTRPGGDRPGGILPAKKKTPSPKEAEEIAANLERFIKRFAPRILERFVTANPTLFAGIHYVYDGYKSIYSVRPLNFPVRGPSRDDKVTGGVSLEIDNRDTDFTVTLKLVGHVELDEVQKYYSRRQRTILSDRVVSIYEHVIRFIMNKHYAVFQRKFFDMATRATSPKVSLTDFVSGFTSAVKMTEFGLALNLHLKTSCVVAQNFTRVLDLVKALLPHVDEERPTRSQLAEASRFLRHLKMSTSHSNRIVTYTIDSLVDKTPYEMKFKDKDGRDVSIGEYFQTTYKLVLEYWPLIKTTGRQARYIPMELCSLIPNQFLSANKVNASIQRELLFKATHAPNAYFRRVTSVAEKVSTLNTDIQKEFGIGIVPKPTALQGRVLPGPEQLNADKRSGFYKVKAPIVKWSVFCFETGVTNEELKDFVTRMMERSTQLGLELGPPCPVTKVDVKDHNTIHNVFYNLFKKKNAEIVFVGIPNRHPIIQPSMMYSMTKHFCDQRYGIISQCFKSEYIRKLPTGYFDNFLLKVNGKMGGLNAILSPANFETLPFSSARTMVVGIDVNHPGETERVSSSIAAAVGSLDPMFTSYSASLRVQKRDREEVINCLDELVEELLEEYRKVNRLLPENLIIFRDGVSDGQFETVRRAEILKIEEGVNRVGKPMKITFIVTQKNHNTRFALAELNRMPRRPTWNVPSGTVVDTVIVNPAYKMFYLNSHFSPLGTSRPTKYTILRDDLNMDADTVQRFCFLACFNSIRTRTVISLPTPVRYADLCAYRAKLHLEAQRELGGWDVEEIRVEEDVEKHIIGKLNENVKISDDMKHVLYYS